MPTYYVFLDPDSNPRRLGVIPYPESQTGGVVIHSFEHPEGATQGELLLAAANHVGPLRIEHLKGASWTPGSDSFEATILGMDEGVAIGSALAGAGDGSGVRLVTAQGYVIRAWGAEPAAATIIQSALPPERASLPPASGVHSPTAPNATTGLVYEAVARNPADGQKKHAPTAFPTPIITQPATPAPVATVLTSTLPK